MSTQKREYKITCKVCGVAFVTTDSRRQFDKPECQVEWKKAKSRARYKMMLTESSGIQARHWRDSNKPTVKVVCAYILSVLPATRKRLESGLEHLRAKHPTVLFTDCIIPNCLMKMRLLKRVKYNSVTEEWEKTDRSQWI